MTPAERDVVMDRLMVAWPKPRMADAQTLLWLEHLTPLDPARALAAIKALETTRSSRPTFADFHTAYGPTGSEKAHASAPPECGICDNGFVEVLAGRIPTVTRCPSGCMPMTGEERQAREAVEAARWADHRRRQRVAGGTRPIDYTEPDARRDLDRDEYGRELKF